MTIDEITKAITWTTEPLNMKMHRIRGKLVVWSEILVPQREVEEHPALQTHMQELITEKILRALYADSRHEMYDALAEFFTLDPFDMQGRLRCRDRLMAAAQYVSPTPPGPGAR